MDSSKILFQQIVTDLKLAESPDEINALAFATLNYFGISRTDVITDKPVELDYSKLLPIISRLNQHEPLQYILNEAWFCGRKFFVDPSVLIPRPETELLVEEASRFLSKKKGATVWDIGTGSGCIAICLAQQFPESNVYATDISNDALAVARRNASYLGARINFIKHDVLSDPPLQEKFDLIVSNPPYISWEEKDTLPKNVINHEPHLALFAHESDALVFFKSISKAANQSLLLNGLLIVEVNPLFVVPVEEVFKDSGLIHSSLKQDLLGNNRFVLGYSPVF